jgi:Lipopolysaccharide-assembly
MARSFFNLNFSWLVSFVLLTSMGCAYHAGRGDRQLPGGYRTVAVPMFKNNTHDAGIEVYMTNALVREFERMKVGRVADKSEAQTTLQGVIQDILYTPNSTNLIPNGSKLNQQYLINLKVNLKLVRNSDQKVLWEGAFVREQSYNTPQIITTDALTSANALYNHSARYQNLEIMANDLMAEAHDRLTENF